MFPLTCSSQLSYYVESVECKYKKLDRLMLRKIKEKKKVL